MRNLLISFLFATCVPQLSVACDYPGFDSIEEHVAAMEHIFLAKALDSQTIELRPDQIREDQLTRFRVIEILKGELGDEVLVTHYTYGPACGVTFEPGEVYEIFAAVRPFTDELVTSEYHLAPYDREQHGWSWEDYRKVAQKQ